jgi:hypothetical protein
MNGQTYLIYTKLADTAYRTIRIKATGYSMTVEPEGKQVRFENGGKTIAVFNVAELVGFAQEDHIVN